MLRVIVLIIAVTAVIVAAGCKDSETAAPNINKEGHTPSNILTRSAKVMEYDGCEYVTYALGDKWGALAHKGNCVRCTAEMKKKIEDGWK